MSNKMMTPVHLMAAYEILINSANNAFNSILSVRYSNKA